MLTTRRVYIGRKRHETKGDDCTTSTIMFCSGLSTRVGVMAAPLPVPLLLCSHERMNEIFEQLLHPAASPKHSQAG